MRVSTLDCILRSIQHGSVVIIRGSDCCDYDRLANYGIMHASYPVDDLGVKSTRSDYTGCYKGKRWDVSLIEHGKP